MRGKQAVMIAFLVPYPVNASPSQRFRFEQYFSLLESTGHRIIVQSFLDSQNWKVFYKKGNTITKVAAIANGLARRILFCLTAGRYDFVFIHREAAPVGPPVFEWIIARVWRRRIIYDFDDAIWLTDNTTEGPLTSFLKWRSKAARICGWSHAVSCGNRYLADYARKFNRNVVVNPTTIDTRNLHVAPGPPSVSRKPVTIGWTGSHSTVKYLDLIRGAIEKILARNADSRFMVIADVRPSFDIPGMLFVPWSMETEIADLLALDIGVMPLPDDEWSKGKCGFKILQYMALGIPAVASPVGANAEIVRHGENGFLASGTEEWEKCIQVLIDDDSLRRRFAGEGLRTVANTYSVAANRANFLSLFI